MKKLLYLSLATLMVLAASCCKKNADSKSSSDSEETVPKEEEGTDTDTPEIESDPTGKQLCIP